MKYQFDSQKSSSNFEKHGIDFEEAQLLWDDPNLIEVRARSSDEARSLVIAKLRGLHWSAVVTYREEETRIISVRRSRKAEVELYES
jgi:uncharacterized DUF497 family protein